MKLNEWMEKNNLNNSQLARLLGHERPDNVRRWRIGECRPQTEAEMRSIYDATNGQVTANDFYGIE